MEAPLSHRLLLVSENSRHSELGYTASTTGDWGKLGQTSHSEFPEVNDEEFSPNIHYLTKVLLRLRTYRPRRNIKIEPEKGRRETCYSPRIFKPLGWVVCVWRMNQKRSLKIFSIHIPTYLRHKTFFGHTIIIIHAYIPKMTANFRYKMGIKNLNPVYVSISLPN